MSWQYDWITSDVRDENGKSIARVNVSPFQNPNARRIDPTGRLLAAGPDLLAALKDQLDGHWATWMAARAEVEGAETSKQLFEREPDVIRARALIAKFEG